jgi:DNA-binding transcriptional LysR family regulator
VDTVSIDEAVQAVVAKESQSGAYGYGVAVLCEEIRRGFRGTDRRKASRDDRGFLIKAGVIPYVFQDSHYFHILKESGRNLLCSRVMMHIVEVKYLSMNGFREILKAGHLLFERSTRSVQLTSAGETLLGYARTILRLNEDAHLRLSGVRHAGRVRVGASEDLSDSWLPKVLHRFGRQYPELEVELEIGMGPKLFEMVESQELDLAVGGLCNGRGEGRTLWSEPLVWAFSEDVEVSSVLPLAFFPEPCPYREAALRALAGSQKQWRIVSRSSSSVGVRAAAIAGLALTPLPLQTLRPGLRVLDKQDKMPQLPEVEYVLHVKESDTRPTVSALANLIRKMAAKAISDDAMDETALASRRPRQLVHR